MKCDCGKLPIVTVGDVGLCVDCYYKLEVAKTLSFRISAIGLNQAAAEMDYISGLQNFTPRIQIPELPRPPMTFNNIKVDNSTIGAINTGNVGSIDVSITNLDQSGQKEIAESLKQFTQSILDAESLSPATRNELLDQAGYLAEQASAAAKERRPGTIKATILGINTCLSELAATAKTATALALAWDKLQPLICKFFGL